MLKLNKFLQSKWLIPVVLAVVLGAALILSYGQFALTFANTLLDSYSKQSYAESLSENDFNNDIFYEYHEDDNTVVEKSADELQNSSINSINKDLAVSLQVQSETLPSKVDLRDRGIVTSAKNQVPWGSCWALSAIGHEIELSAKQLGWFAKTPLSEDESKLIGSQKTQAGEGISVTTYPQNRIGFGGDARSTTHTLAQGIGVANDSEMPYTDSEGRRDGAGADDWSLSDDKRNVSIARLCKSKELGNLAQKSDGEYIGTSIDVLNAMKSIVVT